MTSSAPLAFWRLGRRLALLALAVGIIAVAREAALRHFEPDAAPPPPAAR